MKKYKIKRRRFLYYSGLGAVTVMTWPFISACNSNSANPKNQKTDTEDHKVVPGAFEPDLEFELTAVEKDMSIFSGNLTSV